MIGELGITLACVNVHYDSQSEIYLDNHQVYHNRINLVKICLYFIRDMIELKDIVIKNVSLKHTSEHVVYVGFVGKLES